MKHFCTYFDHNFLSRGLCLVESMKKYEVDFVLWVLCLSDECYETLQKKKIEQLRLIRLSELESADPQLKMCENSRSRIEYYFTMSPCLPLFILQNNSLLTDITYLDADLYFFNSFNLVFTEIAEASVAIIPHNYAPQLLASGAEKNGIFNVGWITWKNDSVGLQCLHWWREKCIDWCYDRHELGRFADQKYLDEWPQLFKNVKILQNPGFNLAPWNAGNYDFKMAGSVLVSDNKLVFYHFHGLKQVSQAQFDCHLRTYFVDKNKSFLIKNLYLPYLNHLLMCHAQPAKSIRAPNNKVKAFIKMCISKLSGDIIKIK